MSSYSIGQVARLAGVTIRTLHHYDEIGLLSPGDRSGAGYRRYGDADIVRLQQVMFYRELGFSLDEIAALLDDPGIDPIDHLRRQRELLTDRQDRTRAMVEAVDKAMEAVKMGISLTPEERLEVFGAEDPGRYADEAQERWGNTEAFKQSQRRTKNYTKDDWLTIRGEAAEIERAFAEALTSGQPATAAAAMDLAERHRQHINRWFYDCSREFHVRLADMYVADERFAEHYERQAEGLAGYVHDAIYANADPSRLDPATA